MKPCEKCGNKPTRFVASKQTLLGDECLPKKDKPMAVVMGWLFALIAEE